MVNATMVRFGYPATLIAEHDHWVVLLRPAAVTLGSLVLVSKSDAEAFGDLPREAFAELGEVVRQVETRLRTFVDFEKINYLMMMMVDPHVHYHVIPRYSRPRRFDGDAYPDAGWPGLPDMGRALDLDPATASRMVDRLRSGKPA